MDAWASLQTAAHAELPHETEPAPKSDEDTNAAAASLSRTSSKAELQPAEKGLTQGRRPRQPAAVLHGSHSRRKRMETVSAAQWARLDIFDAGGEANQMLLSPKQGPSFFDLSHDRC